MQLPFLFARKNNVLFDATATGLRMLITEQTQPEAIQEAQRLINDPFELSILSETEFERHLQRLYAEGAQTSMEGMDDFETDDLSAVMAEVNETQDLLDSQDDAPLLSCLMRCFHKRFVRMLQIFILNRLKLSYGCVFVLMDS